MSPATAIPTPQSKFKKWSKGIILFIIGGLAGSVLDVPKDLWEQKHEENASAPRIVISAPTEFIGGSFNKKSDGSVQKMKSPCYAQEFYISNQGDKTTTIDSVSYKSAPTTEVHIAWVDPSNDEVHTGTPFVLAQGVAMPLLVTRSRDNSGNCASTDPANIQIALNYGNKFAEMAGQKDPNLANYEWDPKRFMRLTMACGPDLDTCPETIK